MAVDETRGHDMPGQVDHLGPLGGEIGTDLGNLTTFDQNLHGLRLGPAALHGDNLGTGDEGALGILRHGGDGQRDK